MLVSYNNRRRRRHSFNEVINVHNMLDNFFDDSLSGKKEMQSKNFKLDVLDKEDEYLVEAELPGIKKDEINIKLDDDKLNISIKRDEEKEEENKDKKYIHKERKYCSMSRNLRLKNIDEDNISAKLEEGILYITIPKAEDEDTKEITID